MKKIIDWTGAISFGIFTIAWFWPWMRLGTPHIFWWMTQGW